MLYASYDIYPSQELCQLQLANSLLQLTFLYFISHFENLNSLSLRYFAIAIMKGMDMIVFVR